MDNEHPYQFLSLAVRETHSEIIRHVENPSVFDTVTIPDKPTGSSPTMRIDLMADTTLCQGISHRMGDVHYVSEERPWKRENLEGYQRVVVADPLDGTQLLAMGLTHWAVSAALLNMREHIVEACATVDAHGVLFASELKSQYHTCTAPTLVQLRSQKQLRGARLALDGRKPEKILRTQALLGQHFSDPAWILGLGGAPAILRVISGHLDATFGRCRGYDFAPAAITAKACGASMTDWNGNPIDAFEVLADPSQKCSWIVACSTQLAADLQEILHDK